MKNTAFLMQDREQMKARTAEKKEIIISFLRDEGFSSADILSQKLGLKGSGAHNTLIALSRDGIVRSEALPAGDRLLKIYGLTPNGAVMASDIENGQIVNFFEPGRVSAWTLAHSLALQKLRLQLEAQGWTEWIGEKQCKRAGQAGKWLKVPDAIALNPQGVRCAIELERSYKSLGRYPEAVAGHLQMIKSSHFEKVIYFCAGNVKKEKMKSIIINIKNVRIQGALVALEKRHYQQFDFVNI